MFIHFFTSNILILRGIDYVEIFSLLYWLIVKSESKVFLMKEMMIHILQKEEIDCGVACVHMLFRYYGYLLDYEWLRKEMIDSTNGTSLQNMVNILKKFNINYLLRYMIILKTIFG